MIISLLLWAAFACCSLVTAAGLAAMHADRGWGDPGSWDGPLVFASYSHLSSAAALSGWHASYPSGQQYCARPLTFGRQLTSRRPRA